MSRMEKDVLLEVEAINTFRGPAHILHDVSLTVAANEVVSLVGRNGAGRTTIIESIIGLLPTRSGKIVFRGNDISRLPPHRRAKRGIRDFSRVDRRRKLDDQPLALGQGATGQRGPAGAGAVGVPGGRQVSQPAGAQPQRRSEENGVHCARDGACARPHDPRRGFRGPCAGRGQALP
ncbi:MAG: ATP-binding cassette domain-containing protein [Alphaproteobacteria bacterium]|nr:MAG: ATP-binding cassette domain-containing protein [Alphaproteobacteria bacterium]